jgi:hypothetical protein
MPDVDPLAFDIAFALTHKTGGALTVILLAVAIVALLALAVR